MMKLHKDRDLSETLLIFIKNQNQKHYIFFFSYKDSASQVGEDKLTKNIFEKNKKSSK